MIESLKFIILHPAVPGMLASISIIFFIISSEKENKKLRARLDKLEKKIKR